MNCVFYLLIYEHLSVFQKASVPMHQALSLIYACRELWSSVLNHCLHQFSLRRLITWIDTSPHSSLLMNEVCAIWSTFACSACSSSSTAFNPFNWSAVITGITELDTINCQFLQLQWRGFLCKWMYLCDWSGLDFTLPKPLLSALPMQCCAISLYIPFFSSWCRIPLSWEVLRCHFQNLVFATFFSDCPR